MTKNVKVFVDVKYAIHGTKRLGGTVYEHTAEWLNLDWDCITETASGTTTTFEEISTSEGDYTFHSLYIPTSNIIAITEVQ